MLKLDGLGENLVRTGHFYSFSSQTKPLEKGGCFLLVTYFQCFPSKKSVSSGFRDVKKESEPAPIQDSSQEILNGSCELFLSFNWNWMQLFIITFGGTQSLPARSHFQPVLSPTLAKPTREKKKGKNKTKKRMNVTVNSRVETCTPYPALSRG